MVTEAPRCTELGGKVVTQEDALKSPRGEIIERGRRPAIPGTGVLLSAEQTVASLPPSLELVFPKGMTVSRKHRWPGRADKETANVEGPLRQDHDAKGWRSRPLQLMTSRHFGHTLPQLRPPTVKIHSWGSELRGRFSSLVWNVAHRGKLVLRSVGSAG